MKTGTAIWIGAGCGAMAVGASALISPELGVHAHAVASLVVGAGVAAINGLDALLTWRRDSK